MERSADFPRRRKLFVQCAGLLTSLSEQDLCGASASALTSPIQPGWEDEPSVKQFVAS